ncbi:MAG: glycerophosphodiester phosphodiesterase [Pseudomonadales bacterium]
MSPPNEPRPRQTPTPLIFGHRGAAGLIAENTLPSFVRALELGVDGVELDVRLGREHLWVMHDATLTRTTGVEGRLEDYDPLALRKLDAGAGASIPHLAEVLELIPSQVQINIELKGPDTAGPVFELTRALPQSQFLISSFDHQQLQHYRDLGGTARIGILLDKWQSEILATARRLDAWSFNLAHRITTQPRIERIHRWGYKVLVYTVNQLRSARRLQRYGVDGLFTDRPDRINRAALAD